MQQGPNLWKWGFLSLVGVVGFLVLGLIALAMIGAQTPGPPAQEEDPTRGHARPPRANLSPLRVNLDSMPNPE